MHKWGIQGYGLYWYCLEMIAQDVGTHNLTFELEHDAELLAHDLRLGRELVENMMRDMVDLGLFEDTGGRISCLKLFTRIDLSQGGSKAFRKAVQDKRKEVISGQSHDCVSDSVMNIDVDIDIYNPPNACARARGPTLQEVTDAIKLGGFTNIDAEAFHANYEAMHWEKNGQPIKDWRPLLIKWSKTQATFDQRDADKDKQRGTRAPTRSASIEDELLDTSWAN